MDWNGLQIAMHANDICDMTLCHGVINMVNNKLVNNVNLQEKIAVQ